MVFSNHSEISAFQKGFPCVPFLSHFPPLWLLKNLLPSLRLRSNLAPRGAAYPSGSQVHFFQTQNAQNGDANQGMQVLKETSLSSGALAKVLFRQLELLNNF
jgi:hypothetical protein